jgi:outer membrane lipoprotein-sorting protein
MKKHFLCFMCLVFVVLAITSCLSKDSIERIVAQEFQEKMDTDSFFSKYDITVRRVVLLKKSTNHYEGKIRILVGGASHSILLACRLMAVMFFGKKTTPTTLVQSVPKY